VIAPGKGEPSLAEQPSRKDRAFDDGQAQPGVGRASQYVERVVQAATAAADPPDDPPGTLLLSRGLCTG